METFLRALPVPVGMVNAGKGFCLGSNILREKILKELPDIIMDSIDEKRIQPSSFEPVIGNEVFIIDHEQGVLRPQVNEQVYRTLLKLPVRQRKRENILDGFELNKGFTYLFKLEERIRLHSDEFVKSSPKSSFGRLFLNTRLLADYNPCFDEINSHYKSEVPLDLWLLVQPLAFNVIIHPGLTLNQLRFFNGLDFQLPPSEIKSEYEKHPIFLERKAGEIVPIHPIITDGLQIHLDLSGRNTGGVVGLRARRNPMPIDLRKTKTYKAENFFEPVKTKKTLTIIQGEHYLFASREILSFPSHLNAELKAYSQIGITGPLHFAGFVDNGFQGDLVFEVRSDELSRMVLSDGMPISKLDIYPVAGVEKVYGEGIGSNYNLQVGPRPSKYFMPFDFDDAARNHAKLDRDVLVNDANLLRRIRAHSVGFEFVSPQAAKDLDVLVQDGFFHSRYDCEFDEDVLQIIPYVLLFGPDNTVFAYVRAQNIKDFGESRLFGKHSLGVGGHIGPEDVGCGNPLLNAVIREVRKEEVYVTGCSKPILTGTLMDYANEVDRVHFGAVFAMRVKTARPKESSMKKGALMGISEVMAHDLALYESWSKQVIPYLEEIRRFVI